MCPLAGAGNSKYSSVDVIFQGCLRDSKQKHKNIVSLLETFPHKLWAAFFPERTVKNSVHGGPLLPIKAKRNIPNSREATRSLTPQHRIPTHQRKTTGFCTSW